jgi:serine/threonine-protein kinase
VDFRSDIYALGVVVYEMFTGQVPFRGDTPISTILKHINDPPPLDGPEASAVPPRVREVLRRALAKDPDERYASAREMGEALRQARSPSRRQQPVGTDALRAPTVKRPPPAPPRPARARRPLQPWLLVVPAAAVAGGVLILYGQGRMSPPAPPTAATAPPGGPPTTEAATTAPATGMAAPPAAVPSLPAPSVAVASARPTPEARHTAAPRPTSLPPPTTVPAMAPATPAPAPTAPPTASAPGLLQVVALPWGEVTVDGRVVGQTPMERISLSAGVHRVRIRHPSYEVWEREVTVRSGQLEKVTVDFRVSGVRRDD